MGPLIASLLPYILGSALVPIQNIINILILKSPQQGLLKSAAFVGGMTTLRLLQGLLFGLIFSSAEDEAGGKSPIVLTLLLVLGILLLITAYKKWRKEEDPDAPPPKWLTLIDDLTPVKAFAFGFAILFISGKAWVFTLSAIALIEAEELVQPAGLVAFLLFVLLSQSFLIISILYRLIAPGRAVTLLEQASDWLTRYNRPIVIGVSLIFGLLFFYQGASGLMNLS